MESPQGFVEEIDAQELYLYEVVGKGAFGVVSRASWRGKDVAVKLIETESERKAFLTELLQLSRVNHMNIVKLYGACTRPPAVCLVMEYAEGGSLYNVLHGSGPQPSYTAAHAMSWALQCARGVEYLHSMKPKALIHRDLKPPNLLLIMGGTVLKICDFGTACDIQTHMTNNKGSAAWMAPEVFEGSNYSEKCDVFSWGIILWEVITRRKPFDEIGGPAFRIMWAVHNGTRPPLIRNLPKPLELLMTRSWHSKPVERPSMAEVVRIMSHLFQFFSGAEEPLVYPAYAEDDSGEYEYTQPHTGSQFTGSPSMMSTNNIPQSSGGESRTSTFTDTVRQSGDYYSQLVNRNVTPVSLNEEENKSQKSAPPSLSTSRESLAGIHSPRAGTPVDYNKRYSADLTFSNLQEYDTANLGTGGSPIHQKGTHRRNPSDGSYPDNNIMHGGMVAPPTNINIQQSPPATIHHVSTYPGSIKNSSLNSSREATPTPQTASLGASRENTPPFRSVSYTPPGTDNNNKGPSGRSTSWSSENPIMSPLTPLSVNVNVGPAMGTSNMGDLGGMSVSSVLSNPLNHAMSLVYQSLDHQYQPIAPCPTSKESMEIYEKHCKLAQQYLRYQTEIAMFEQQRHELLKELREDVLEQHSTLQVQEEYKQLTKENESLKRFHENLTKQLDQLRKKNQQNKRVAT